MSEVYKTYRTYSSTNKSIKRPNSANSSNNAPIQMHKRDKLRNLLIEKLIKKFSAEEYKDIIQKQVTNFISKEKLTEMDLMAFENNLANILQNKKSINSLRNNFENDCISNYDNMSNYSDNNKAKQIQLKDARILVSESNDKKINSTKTLNNKINKKKNTNSFLKSGNGAFDSNKHLNKIDNTFRAVNVKNGMVLKDETQIKIQDRNNVVTKKDVHINKDKEPLYNTKKSDLKDLNLDKDNLNTNRTENRNFSVKNSSSRQFSLEHINNDLNNKLDIDDIKNFELKKLLLEEKRPLERLNFEEEGDEWQAIDKYKQSLYMKNLNNINKHDKEIKMKNKQAFDRQLMEKAQEKNKNKIIEMNHYENIMSNVERLHEEENKKMKEIRDKKLKEKEFREQQIKDNIIRKRQDYLQKMKSDKELLSYNQKLDDLRKNLELEKKIKAKEEFKKTLQDNEISKKLQNEKLQKEIEDDRKAMEDYTKILDKLEKERADYFKRCENKQKAFMDRMQNTVIEEQNNNIKQEEIKIQKYQEEKNRRDEDEDNKRKTYQLNSKQMIKDYLLMQMGDKKETTLREKLEEKEQLKLLSKENDDFFKKENEINEKIKQTRVHNAEFVKSQMKPSKRIYNEKMNDEEYRLNKDILDEIISGQSNDPAKFSYKRNFLI